MEALALINKAFACARSTFSGDVINLRGNGPPVVTTCLRAGRLVLAASTELRMRFWLLQDPSVTIADLLPRCLAKGLPFRMFVSQAALPQLAPADLSIFPATPVWLTYPDALIQQGCNKGTASELRDMCIQYRRLVAEVLSRPHARRFLTAGGLLWRIAREYGPPDLFRRALQGPSATVTIYGRSDIDRIHKDVDDLLIATEIDVLLGRTTNSNSFWPSPEIYEGSPRYNGEWSAENEAWFVRHADLIENSGVGSLKSSQAWKNDIRPHTATKRILCSTVGSQAHAHDVCVQLQGLFPCFWAHWDFTTLC